MYYHNIKNCSVYQYQLHKGFLDCQTDYFISCLQSLKQIKKQWFLMFSGVIERLVTRNVLTRDLLINTIVSLISSRNTRFHNILRLFDVLSNPHFTTSETIGDYYLYTWYIRIASRVAERRKTQDLRKLRNIRKLSKPHRMIAQCPVPLPK